MCSRNMKCFFLLFIIFVPFADCLDFRGDPCTTDDDLEGICLHYQECEYVQNMVEVLEEKPTDCYINVTVRLVCCPEPLNTTVSKFGPKQDTGNDSVKIPDEPIRVSYKTIAFDGIIWSNGIVCRFDGHFPMTCSQLEYPAHKPEPVPPGCPELQPLTYDEDFAPKTYLPHAQVVHDACRNYTEVGSKCVLSSETGNYVRKDCEFASTFKVSHGVPVALKEYPHTAILGTIRDDAVRPFVWWGGGSLISEYFILTAAHVLYYDVDNPIQFAMLGAINKTDIRSGVIYQVVKIIRHHGYEMTKKVNDIALLELNRRVTFTEFIRPICLMIPGLVITNERIVAGWGDTKHNQKDSAVLLQAMLYEQPVESCQKSINQKSFKFDNATMICAGAGAFEKKNGGQMSDSCYGDSGGPLMGRSVSQPRECTNLLVGIVSSGTVCGVGEPALYTKVANRGYFEWIVPIVWPESLNQKMHPPIELQ